LPAAEVSLAAVTGRIENHQVNVDPTAVLSDQLNTNRSPVSLRALAPALQNPQRHRLAERTSVGRTTCGMASSPLLLLV